MVQDADAIWREEIDKAGIAHEIGQYFAALTNMRSVGVSGEMKERMIMPSPSAPSPPPISRQPKAPKIRGMSSEEQPVES